MSGEPTKPTNGQDRISPEDLFEGFIEPPKLPTELNRGHFASLTGHWTTLRMCLPLLVMSNLTDGQRHFFRERIRRMKKLTIVALAERKRRGKDREVILYTQGCLDGLNRLLESLG